jgi:hypothetical protein
MMLGGEEGSKNQGPVLKHFGLPKGSLLEDFSLRIYFHEGTS